MFGTGEVWGIAFGSTDLRAVKMARSGDQISVLEMEIVPFAPAGGEEGEDRELKARQALQSLVAKHKIKRETVAISVPGNAVFSKFITLPPVEKKRVPEIVKYESRQQIPFPIDEVVWDYQLVKSELVPGEDIEVALFAIRREIVQVHLASCLAAGLKPRFIQAAPLAFCNFLQHDQPSDDPVAVLDVGQDSTELLIVDGERYWPRSLGVGSRDLTVALQQKFQISLEKAEELKTQAVKSKQADRLFGVMKPVLQNLSGQVQRTLGFYKSQHPEVRFAKVLLVGDFFDLPGIEGFFKEALRYEFARLGAPRRVAPDEGVARPEFEAQAPALGIPIGLGLQALGVGRVQTNLIPPESVQIQRQAAKRPWVGAAVLLAGAAVGFEILRTGRDERDLATANTTADDCIARAKTRIDALAKARQEPPKLLEELGRLPALLKERETGLPPEAFHDILKRVVEVVPVNDIWIDDIRIEPVLIGSIPNPKDKRAPWCKDKEQRQTLKVRFSGRKVVSESGEGRKELQFVRDHLVAGIRAIQAGNVPFCDLFDTDWVSTTSTEASGGQDYFIFTVEWIVNPGFYEVPPAPPAPAAP